ncbi:MAG: hypothetical protein WDM81_10050 [Rhizomicrobium sp.]
MSAAGLIQQQEIYVPRRIIAAHADHRRTDFVFSRTQSREMRGTPWGRRIRPMRSWSEIGSYAGVALAATILATTFI